ncbi:MAG: hypothetical protein ACP5RH_22030, partial [Leptodesmis sp.]|uniref:hypothetical protein n=1 Tax=Leptodesmis sp. TaxID=3100501 RepID=UPI003D0D122E
RSTSFGSEEKPALYRLSGQRREYITNRTGKAIGRATINYATYLRESDTKWTLIYSGSTRTEARQLQAGEKSSFSAIPLRKGDKVVITKVEF